MTNGANTILLVEDDDADIELAMHIMKEKIPEPRIIVARNGSEALDLFFSTPRLEEMKNLRLMFLDLHMPGIDGFEVLRRIKTSNEWKHIPIIVLTSSNEIKDIEYCYKHGANSYVVKPISIEQYEEMLKGILHFWLNINQTALTHLPLPMMHS